MTQVRRQMICAVLDGVLTPIGYVYAIPARFELDDGLPRPEPVEPILVVRLYPEILHLHAA